MDTANALNTLDSLDTPDTSDTVVPARLDRECQGPWEAEYSYGEEADLHRHYDNCTKNPGHKNFISVDKFSIEDLPERYRDNDMVDYIRAVSDLTVRVTVKYVSARRPETIGVSGRPYQGYLYKGQSWTTVRTGMVNRVDIWDDKMGQTCKCKDCRKSSTPQTTFANISVRTAAHVVYDESEAEHTTCHLFFDREGSPETCEGVVALTGMHNYVSDTEPDNCEMDHHTHDLELAQRLKKRCQQREYLRCNIKDKLLKTTNFKHRQPTLDKQPLLFIVSHPHGCSKQISIGRWTGGRNGPTGRPIYAYTTATCRGSGGAPVCLPLVPKQLGTGEFHSSYPTHVGEFDKKLGLNYCYVIPDMDTLDTPATPDTMDTLALAKQDRERQGPWEAEYSYGEEADLHRHNDNCTKNPGHENFIPVDKFSIEDLPERYRDNDMVDYIRAVSDLTVRVTVKYVSEKRPETVGESGKPYLNYCYRGQWRTSVGTGMVDSVFICDDEMGQTCMCKDCRNSSTPQTTFARISINTAAHVVFDKSEGEHTTCHLFFDREGTPESCKGVVTLTGMLCMINETEPDYCYMRHHTHDLELAQRLDQRCKEMANLRRNIRDKLLETRNFKCRQPTLDKQPLLIIVSHPHGCSKQISIGRWTSTRERPNHSHCFTYTTATCPGSSGAPVCMPQNTEAVRRMKTLLNYSFHVGVFDEQPGMNYTIISRSQGPVKYPYHFSLQQDQGPWEEKFVCGEEEDLQKHYDTCQKNPGHENFFPVDKFSMDNLPPCYRKQEIMEMIKCVSGLTVRVSVKYVSEERPETVPGTDIPYPWHSNRGSNQLRVGSGWVTEVEYLNGACECEECKSSDSPKIGYAHVYVETAAHLVCDELVGKHTTCHLFYDSGEAPDVCKGVVTLRNMCHMNTNEDFCKLMYKTHDLDPVGKLIGFKRDYDNFLNNLQLINDWLDRTHNNTSNEDLAPLVDIMISHPHGRAKQIAIGYYGSHGNTDTENNQCLYNSITCPGSGGAPVITLGRTWLYPSIE